MPVLELAEREVRKRQLIPTDLSIKWIPYDDKCDASYATISAMDGYGIDCGHVLFGPTCDYALGKKKFYLNFALISFFSLFVDCFKSLFLYGKNFIIFLQIFHLNNFQMGKMQHLMEFIQM